MSIKVNPITAQQYDTAINPKKGKVTLPEVVTAKPKNAATVDQEVYARSIDPADPAYSRQILPSRGFFYSDKKDLVVRPLRVGDLKKIQHFLNSNNISHLIDAIQNCVEEGADVRELTFDDFIYVIFRIVFDSHPKPEYKFVWNSFYGNEGEEIITPSTLSIKDLDYARLLKELPEYKDLGLSPCLVKSYEALHNNRYNEEDETTWDEEKTWLYEEVACYLEASSLEEQFNRAENMPLKSPEFQKLKQFKNLSKHSIMTELEVYDKNFKPEEAIVTLKERVESLRLIKTSEPEVYRNLAENVIMNIDAIEEEVVRIETAVTLSQEVRAIDEVTPFRFNLAELTKSLFA